MASLATSCRLTSAWSLASFANRDQLAWPGLAATLPQGPHSDLAVP